MGTVINICNVEVLVAKERSSEMEVQARGLLLKDKKNPSVFVSSVLKVLALWFLAGGIRGYLKCVWSWWHVSIQPVYRGKKPHMCESQAYVQIRHSDI